QRRELDAVLYAAQHLLGDGDGVREALAAVDDAVADGVHVADRADGPDAGVGRSDPADDGLDRRARVAHRRGRAPRLRPFGLKRDYRLAADALDLPARQTLVRVLRNTVEVCGDDLKLDGRAA